jgi:hypothetical protein
MEMNMRLFDGVSPGIPVEDKTRLQIGDLSVPFDPSLWLAPGATFANSLMFANLLQAPDQSWSLHGVAIQAHHIGTVDALVRVTFPVAFDAQVTYQSAHGGVKVVAGNVFDLPRADTLYYCALVVLPVGAGVHFTATDPAAASRTGSLDMAPVAGAVDVSYDGKSVSINVK